MIDRYTRAEMAAVWREERKLEHWLRIEILATEARAERGEVPASDVEEIKSKARFDLERIKEIEKLTQHDVAAFIDNVSEGIGPASRHLHYGMTSSDVLDTALALQLGEAGSVILDGLAKLIEVTIRRAREHQSDVCPARTHGIHAEPTTFGLKVAGWAFELDRGRSRIAAAREGVMVGKISGVVGTYSQLPPEIEEYVCEKLGLTPDSSSTQVVSRDRHAAFVAALAGAAATIERIATEIRHLARTEVREVEEPFDEGKQKGSSAMPHKRNPWRCERLAGLARVVRAAAVPAWENVALWDERDISHSSVERTLLPDACIALDFMIAEMTEILDGLLVYPDRMRKNLDASFGLLFSQNVLLRLIDAGLTRDDAYRIVQANAMEAWKTGTHLRDLLLGDSEVSSLISRPDIEQCFDESRYLVHVGRVIDRLKSLEG